MNRRYLSDRVPQFDPHPDDVATLLEKLEEILPRDMGPYGGFHPKDVATVLAALLCESLGLSVSAMRSLVTRRGRVGIRRNPKILEAGGCLAVDKMTRRILRAQLALPDAFDEVADEGTLHRIGGLVAFALNAYIGKVVEQIRWEGDTNARAAQLERFLQEAFQHNGVLVHIEDDYLVIEYRGDSMTAQVDIFP